MANETLFTNNSEENDYTVPVQNMNTAQNQNLFERSSGMQNNQQRSVNQNSTTVPEDVMRFEAQESRNAIDDPQTLQEAQAGSFLAVLQDNLGYYVVIEFLIGTNGLTEKEGILYSAGNNFVTLYEAETNRYILCDLYSIKFVTFYNQTTRPRSRALPTSGRQRRIY